MTIKVLWYSSITTRIFWRRDFPGYALGLNPLRDIALADRPYRWPAWAMPSYVLGPYHRCGHQMYYPHYEPHHEWADGRPISSNSHYGAVYERNYGSQCVICKLAQLARSRRELRAARKRVGRIGGALRQRVSQLELPPPPAPEPEPRHHCSQGSMCRTRAGRQRIDEKSRPGDEVTFCRCWYCGCFFPQWRTPVDKPARLCSEHEQPGLRSLWPLVTAIRHVQSITTTSTSK